MKLLLVIKNILVKTKINLKDLNIITKDKKDFEKELICKSKIYWKD